MPPSHLRHARGDPGELLNQATRVIVAEGYAVTYCVMPAALDLKEYTDVWAVVTAALPSRMLLLSDTTATK